MKFRFRFSLKLLCILIFFVALSISYVPIFLMPSIRSEKQTLNHYRDLGAEVYTINREPVWLWKFVGEEYSQQPTSLHLQNPTVGDAELTNLAVLDDITGLYLNETSLTNEGLRHLNGLQNLVALSLRRTDISQPPPIEKMPLLQSLDLSFTNVSQLDASGLPELVSLELRGTKVDDSTLATLSNLQKLETLDVAGSGRIMEITDLGLKHLESITSLRNLYLYHTRVTDEAIEELKSMNPNLTVFR